MTAARPATKPRLPLRASPQPAPSIGSAIAPRLVRFAGISSGDKVLDVACGTGVVALTAARLGASCIGVDLTPDLIARARENSALMKLDVHWHEGDAEALPLGDAQFDVVVSQFGHMFAPRPEIAIKEMLRVLKPGGTIAFSTWPPEMFVGRSSAISARYAPPPPGIGIAPPPQWGDPQIVRERLGAQVKDLCFARDVMWFQTLSPAHMRVFMERNIGPMARMVATLEKSDPQKLASFRSEMEALIGEYFEDNHLRQDYLLTRAVKA